MSEAMIFGKNCRGASDFRLLSPDLGAGMNDSGEIHESSASAAGPAAAPALSQTPAFSVEYSIGLQPIP